MFRVWLSGLALKEVSARELWPDTETYLPADSRGGPCISARMRFCPPLGADGMGEVYRARNTKLFLA